MTDAAYYDVLPREEYREPEAGRSFGSELTVLALIWTPWLLLAGVGYLAGYLYVSGLALVIAAVIHALVRPRVAVYALAMAICLYWVFEFFPGRISSSAKLVGVLAVAVNLPKLIAAVVGHRKDPAAIWVIVMVVWTLVQAPVALSVMRSLEGVTSVAFIYGVPVLLCVSFRDRRSLRMLLFVLVLAGLASTVAMLTTPGAREALAGGARVEASSAAGMEINANEMAPIMGVCIFSCGYFIVLARGVFLRLAVAASALGIAAGFVVTKSRGAYLAFPLSVMGAILFLKGAGLKKRVMVVVISLAAALTGAVVGHYAGLWQAGIIERFQSIFEGGAGSGERYAAWRGYFTEFYRSGFIGRGITQGGYAGAVREYVGYDMAAHNSIVQIAGDLGLVGLVCFFGLHIHLFRRIRRVTEIWPQFFLLCYLIFIVLAGMTHTNYLSKYYGLTLGVIFVVLRIDEARREAAYPPAAAEP